MIVTLSNADVEILDSITWGQQEAIRSAMLGGIRVQGLTDKEKQSLDLDASILTKAKYKTIEVCVKKITLKDGTDIPYTKEWMDNLTVDDGDTLFAAINAVTSPEKK